MNKIFEYGKDLVIKDTDGTELTIKTAKKAEDIYKLLYGWKRAYGEDLMEYLIGNTGDFPKQELMGWLKENKYINQEKLDAYNHAVETAEEDYYEPDFDLIVASDEEEAPYAVMCTESDAVEVEFKGYQILADFFASSDERLKFINNWLFEDCNVEDYPEMTQEKIDESEHDFFYYMSTIVSNLNDDVCYTRLIPYADIKEKKIEELEELEEL